MEQFLGEFLKQGILGLVAGVFLWLYVSERSDHQKTRDKLELSQNNRIDDSKENMEKVTTPLQGISQGIQNLSDKIEISKGQK